MAHNGKKRGLEPLSLINVFPGSKLEDYLRDSKPDHQDFAKEIMYD